jgi:DNA polymerase III delta subunit
MLGLAKSPLLVYLKVIDEEPMCSCLLRNRFIIFGMHYLIHGDYHVRSREYLGEILDDFHKKGWEVQRLSGSKMILEELIHATGTNSLFGADQALVIEDLFSRPKSRALDEILDWLKSYVGSLPLIFWEKKSIGKILQRKLPAKTTAKEFKTPVLVFRLVELLSPKTHIQAQKTLGDALKSAPAEFLFVMIVRQVRLMLLLKGGQNPAGAPWMISKLKKQASDFATTKVLVKAYQHLYNIDRDIKTGQTVMPLAWHLREFVLSIG